MSRHKTEDVRLSETMIDFPVSQGGSHERELTEKLVPVTLSIYLFHLFLQVPDSRLPAVLSNEQTEGIRGDGGLLLRQTTQRAQLRHQVTLNTHTKERN